MKCWKECCPECSSLAASTARCTFDPLLCQGGARIEFGIAMGWNQVASIKITSHAGNKLDILGFHNNYLKKMGSTAKCTNNGTGQWPPSLP